MADILKPNFNNGLWASGGAIVAPSNVKIATGWTAEVPPFQWENYSQNRQDQGIAHILQHGISVWDALTEYQSNKSYVTGSDGVIYRSVQTNTNQNPVTDTTNTYWVSPVGKLSRVLIYTRVAGVQRVSINGAASTTTGATTYTPLPGLFFADIEAVGGGGAGGGSVNPTAGNVALGAPGSSGSYARAIILGATIGASQSVVVGVGGVGNSAAAGGSGTTTSLGSLLSCPGGGGGLSSAAGGVAVPSLLGQTSATSSPTGGNLLSISGTPGGPSISMAATVVGSYGGQGGGSPLGSPTQFAGANTSGITATSYGSGGSGQAVLNGFGPATGANGGQGALIIREYI